MRRGIECQNEK
uniref:Uncharacterized protein n=1 Tax=Vitis vinifera TaxID=29760 RepID=F6HR89_VITVI